MPITTTPRAAIDTEVLDQVVRAQKHLLRYVRKWGVGGRYDHWAARADIVAQYRRAMDEKRLQGAAA